LASPADRSVPRSAADDASRGSAIKLGAELLGRLLALATTLLVARVLGVSDFGLFAVLSGIAVLVAELSDLGLQGIAVQSLVYTPDGGQESDDFNTVARHRGFRKFFLLVFICGAVIRFFTSPTFVTFITDALDPKSW